MEWRSSATQLQLQHVRFNNNRRSPEENVLYILEINNKRLGEFRGIFLLIFQAKFDC